MADKPKGVPSSGLPEHQQDELKKQITQIAQSLAQYNNISPEIAGLLGELITKYGELAKAILEGAENENIQSLNNEIFSQLQNIKEKINNEVFTTADDVVRMLEKKLAEAKGEDEREKIIKDIYKNPIFQLLNGKKCAVYHNGNGLGFIEAISIDGMNEFDDIEITDFYNILPIGGNITLKGIKKEFRFIADKNFLSSVNDINDYNFIPNNYKIVESIQEITKSPEQTEIINENPEEIIIFIKQKFDNLSSEEVVSILDFLHKKSFRLKNGEIVYFHRDYNTKDLENDNLNSQTVFLGYGQYAPDTKIVFQITDIQELYDLIRK